MLDALIIMPEITKGMKSIGSKSLLKIKDSTSILEYQIQQIKAINKKTNIHIVAGFEIEKIKKVVNKSKINILYENDYINTSQSKCLKLFLNNYNTKKLLVVSNGIIFKNNPFDMTEWEKSKVFLIDKPKINFNIGCCNTINQDIDYLFYDLPLSWSECLYLSEDAIYEFKKKSNHPSMDNMYLFEVINSLISSKITFTKSFIEKKNIMKINTLQDISKAKNFI